MNYKWEKKEEFDQLPKGFIEMYKSELDKQAVVLAVITYLQQEEYNNFEKEAVVNLYYEGEIDVTDKKTEIIFHSILYDLFDIIESNDKTRFPHNNNKRVNRVQMYYFPVETLPKIKYIGHLNYTIDEKIVSSY